jgi:hypothetical protein
MFACTYLTDLFGRLYCAETIVPQWTIQRDDESLHGVKAGEEVPAGRTRKRTRWPGGVES